MPKINYPRVINEDQEELEKLEKRHRYSHLFHRVKMLRLLKSGECSDLGQAAEALGYSWRQCQRWFATYRRGSLGELLVSRVDVWSVGSMSAAPESWSPNRRGRSSKKR